MQVAGNLANIKTYLLEQLKSIYELSVPIGQLSTRELNARLVGITDTLDREVAVYVNRQGKVVQVSLGDADTVDLPEIRRQSRSDRRLSGIRCIHTHPSGDVRLSEPDLSSLRRLRFDCMAAIGRSSDGSIIGALGFLSGETGADGMEELSSFGPVSERILNQVHLPRLIWLSIKARCADCQNDQGGGRACYIGRRCLFGTIRADDRRIRS